MSNSQILDRIKVLTQNSIRIETEQAVIYIDPFQIQQDLHDADLILITHDHYDHFSPEDIAKILKKETILVVPEAMIGQSRKIGLPEAQVISVSPMGQINVSGIQIETVPAYNLHKPFHLKQKGWVGYILLLGQERCYIAGDTDITPENQKVVCDIALVPIGGTYTMNANKAAQLINTIKPRIAIPTHYGTIVGKKEDAVSFEKAVNPDIQVVIKLFQ